MAPGDVTAIPPAPDPGLVVDPRVGARGPALLALVLAGLRLLANAVLAKPRKGTKSWVQV